MNSNWLKLFIVEFSTAVMCSIRILTLFKIWTLSDYSQNIGTLMSISGFEFEAFKMPNTSPNSPILLVEFTASPMCAALFSSPPVIFKHRARFGSLPKWSNRRYWRSRLSVRVSSIRMSVASFSSSSRWKCFKVRLSALENEKTVILVLLVFVNWWFLLIRRDQWWANYPTIHYLTYQWWQPSR